MQGRLATGWLVACSVACVLLAGWTIRISLRHHEQIESIKGEMEKLVNRLTVDSYLLQKSEVGYVLHLAFKGTRPEPLGKMAFEFYLPKATRARILEAKPTRDGGTFEYSKDSLWISRDGTEASLIYNLWSNTATLQVTLTEPSPLYLVGNHGIPFLAIRMDDLKIGRSAGIDAFARANGKEQSNSPQQQLSPFPR